MFKELKEDLRVYLYIFRFGYWIVICKDVVEMLDFDLGCVGMETWAKLGVPSE